MSKKVDDLIKQTHSLWKQGREKEMIPYFEEIIEILKNSNDKKRLVEELNNYAGVLRVAGDYDKAIKISLEACNLIEENYSTNSESYATSLMNLGNIYRMKGDFYNSEKLFLKSEELLNKLNISNYSVAGLYNNMALLYQSLFQYEKAYNYQMKSIEINKRDSKYNVPLGISYNNLYEICKKLNKLEEAERHLNEAEKILEKEVGTVHPLYCSVLNNFADLCFSKKEIEKSFSLYKLILPLVEKFYGKESEYYISVKNNYNKVEKELSQNNNDENKDSLVFTKNYNEINGNGMKIARDFFHNEVFPIFKKTFLNLIEKTAFGLVGQGSECFGFDDEISTDHDFGKRCCIWLDDEISIKNKEEIENYFKKINGNIQVYYVSEFYKYYTLFKDGPRTLEEFRKVPSDLLAVATNGEIFYDSLGKFTEIRERLLKFYPQDLIYKKMAFCLNKIAQSGQYNYGRCLKRNNFIGCEMALSEFIKYYCHFWHLVNKKYMPFYKWYQKSLEKLDFNGYESVKKLEKLLSFNPKERENYIEILCCEIKDYLINNNLSTNNTTFLTYHSKEIISHIKNNELRLEDTWIE